MICLGLGKFHSLPVDFLSVNEHFRRSGDAEPDFVSIHGQDRDGNAAINDNLFADFP